jgi:prepilin-type processing-associated H-X9-DG protein
VTGIGRNDGYFDCHQWSGIMAEREKGILHTVGSAGLSYENMGSVLDGTSNTLAVGEYMTRTTSNRGTFWAYAYTSYSLSSIQYESRLYMTDYNLCGQPQMGGTPPGHNPCKRAFASFHPGGINFALVDGSTRFISSSVDLINSWDLRPRSREASPSKCREVGADQLPSGSSMNSGGSNR